MWLVLLVGLVLLVIAGLCAAGLAFCIVKDKVEGQTTAMTVDYKTYQVGEPKVSEKQETFTHQTEYRLDD